MGPRTFSYQIYTYIATYIHRYNTEHCVSYQAMPMNKKNQSNHSNSIEANRANGALVSFVSIDSFCLIAFDCLNFFQFS